MESKLARRFWLSWTIAMLAWGSLAALQLLTPGNALAPEETSSPVVALAIVLTGMMFWAGIYCIAYDRDLRKQASAGKKSRQSREE